MLGNACQGQTDAVNGVFDSSPARDIESEIAGDGIDADGVQRDTASVDGRDQLTGAGVDTGWFCGCHPAGAKARKKTLRGGLSHTLAFA